MQQQSYADLFYIAAQFFQRDFFIYRRRMFQFFINYAVWYPIIYAFSFGFLQSRILFSFARESMSAILFSGDFLAIVVLFSFQLCIDLLFDLESIRYINYQITILPSLWIIMQRVLFTTFFTFILLTPFFPIGKLLLGDALPMSNMYIGSLIIMLLVSCFMSASYSLFIAAWLPSSYSIGILQRRINPAMFLLGGVSVPLYTLSKTSTILGKLALFNPLLYVSEGIRRALLGQDLYLPVWICVTALMGFSVLFIYLTKRLLKKRLDHV